MMYILEYGNGSIYISDKQELFNFGRPTNCIKVDDDFEIPEDSCIYIEDGEVKFEKLEVDINYENSENTFDHIIKDAVNQI